ncbi:YlmC/YmxH family sporulation protein [Carboxydochorda subterranea]|uniref:YlmC/YmxH family sporulation protein n=1 Tax=Carboxydichorda subterranea TaxID=3109565 RepID=A0ABZ1C247_9FIRM|nr:YlmC/YmxH family sporulation protein [Limnochorda sp. L945t]WRP18352.1 YlmC/YmxH family sporulation protein [Limnochorda sp. L945t]
MSQLIGKEIVDLSQGIRIGPVREADLVIQVRGGRIDALVLPVRHGLWGRREVVVPWNRVLKVGPDVIIVELGERPSTGMNSTGPERLHLVTSRQSDRKESVDGGNGHWRLRHPGAGREGRPGDA